MPQTCDKVIDLSRQIERLFDNYFDKESESQYFDGWKDMIWSSDVIRKCHLKTIDHLETRKMWLMHINIFPQPDINLPILGFDIVSGLNKITGAFYDYSNCMYHPYSDYLEAATRGLEWNKPRELPEWAQQIFSPNMIAIGNVKDEEVDQLCHVALDLTTFYVENINQNAFKEKDMTAWHNMYCINQKKNPHLHKSLLSMGLTEEQKDEYIERVLFEEL